MSPRTRAASAAPVTTANRLSSIVKSARDIMRKDKGLNGDLDRLPMLTWIMFLKFLDDIERARETEAEMAGERFVPAIEAPYRWRDWASPDDGITGEALIAFVNNERVVLPSGAPGAGLFAYLRGLQGANGGDRRDVIATVFRGAINRMINGYLLRDVINKVDEIHFESSDEIHTLGTLYESMLREMRDAAGDSGEFYTPRPVVRFMVEVTEPTLGETVLDPACGTGGFLVESYLRMLRSAATVEDRQLLESAILGGEAKPLPYLLAQMNLLLHGMDLPRISPGNSLAVRVSEIGERDRVDVILTNPPFGGEEERGIQDGFPPDRQTAETALLFLQLIMRKLRRRPGPTGQPSRAAVVVPNGTLFGAGIAERVRRDLIEEFNLHTVVRLPGSVFAPYTPIPTNILFFDTRGRTDQVWFYQQPGPEGRQRYTKTRPITFAEFNACISWWSKREAGANAWVVSAEDLRRQAYNLDQSPPRAEAVRPGTMSEAIKSAGRHARDLLGTLDDVHELAASSAARAGAPIATFESIMTQRKEFIRISDDSEYKRCRVRLRGQGVVLRDVVRGADVKTKSQQQCRPGELLVAEIDAKLGGFAIVPPDLEGAIVSSHYFLFELDDTKVEREYLGYFLRTRAFQEQVSAQGSTNYASIRPAQVLAYQMPLPSLPEQARIAQQVGAILQRLESLRANLADLTSDAEQAGELALAEAFEMPRT